MKWFALDRGSKTSLIRQIYEEIGSQILRGELAVGDRLPSSRDIAAELGVSRIVAVEAYELLQAEGFVLSIAGAGTFVADSGHLEARPAPPTTSIAHEDREGKTKPAIIDFRSGAPALDLLPMKKWAQLEYSAFVDVEPNRLGYAPPEGSLELREALYSYLRRKRGIECDPDQIIVTTGAMQAFALIARLISRPSTTMLFEDPTSAQIRKVFAETGATIQPVPVDDRGIETASLPSRGRPVGIFVTPSHQFPLGGCLPIPRRIELVNYARRMDCFIVEDDYESEFRYAGDAVSSLQRLDPERVLYVGTFSKIFFPALRLGYLVLPKSLLPCFSGLKSMSDRYTPVVSQLAMARFIAEGHLDRHIAKMKRLYRRRRDALIAALQESFGERVAVMGRETGMHLTASFPVFTFTPSLIESLRAAGVGVYAVDELSLQKGRYLHEIILGYSHLSSDEIHQGIGILKRALEQETKLPSFASS